MNQTA